MGHSLRALGLLGIAFVGLWYSAGGAKTLSADSDTVAAPLAHGNLSVYFVYGSDSVAGAKLMTLQEALERELAVVHETSDVNTLAVENRSPDCELFIQSGDIVKGGKQDRMAATDMLVSPGSGRVALPAHCVEQGRWTNRGTEDAKRFNKSDTFAAGKELKYANASGRQTAVWQTVSGNQDKLRTNVDTNVTENASPTSFQLTLEAPAIRAKVAEYEAALKAAGDARGNIVGVVFVVNGQITGAEVYGSNALFRKAWPKLLNAAAVEAVAERTDKPATAPPTPRAIERFLARGADPEPVGTRETRDGELNTAVEYLKTLQTRRSHNNRDSARIQLEGRSIPSYATTVFDPTPPPNRALLVGGVAGNRIEGNETTGNRVVMNQIDLRPGQAANSATNAPVEPVSVHFDTTPWDEVLDWYAKKTGLTLITTVRPTGNLTLKPGDDRKFTTSEVTDLLNEALTGQRLILIRRHMTFFIQPADERIDPTLAPRTAQPTSPTNPDGNRLSSNRMENRSTLMVESRDPARQNAVIHRSYIKK